MLCFQVSLSDTDTKTFINKNPDTSYGGIIARKNKKKKAAAEEGTIEATSREPKPEGNPILYFAGLITLFIGLLIAIGSLVHNNLKIMVNETSYGVYGPYDWLTAIVGAIALLVGIVLLLFSRGTRRST